MEIKMTVPQQLLTAISGWQVGIIGSVITLLATWYFLGNPWAIVPREALLETPSRTTPARTMILLGSGGHSAEMLAIVRQLVGQTSARRLHYWPRIYIISEGDMLSTSRLRAMETGEWASIEGRDVYCVASVSDLII